MIPIFFTRPSFEELQVQIEQTNALPANNQYIDELINCYLQKLLEQLNHVHFNENLVFIYNFLNRAVSLSPTQNLENQIKACRQIFRKASLPISTFSLPADAICLINACLTLKERASFFRVNQDVATSLRQTASELDLSICKNLDAKKYRTQLNAIHTLATFHPKLQSPLLTQSEKQSFFNEEISKILQEIWETDSAIQNNKKIALLFLSQDVEQWEHLSTDLKNNANFMMKAVKQHEKALEYASDKVKNNRSVVLAAIANYPRALQYASFDLKNDREVVLTALAKDGLALQFVSTELKSYRDICLAALAQSVWAFSYASDALKHDKEFALVAVRLNRDIFKYIPDALKNDEDIIEAATQKRQEPILSRKIPESKRRKLF
jgi:hypothetical protein